MIRTALLAVVCASCVAARDLRAQRRAQGSLESRQLLANSNYDFVIEGLSYKFWYLFQIATVTLLLYCTIGSVYYSNYTFYTSEIANSGPQNFLLRRSVRGLSPKRSPPAPMGLDPATFLRILDSVSSLKVP